MRVALFISVVIFISGAFLIGYSKFPNPALSNSAALGFGFSSALLWGLSVTGGSVWNSIFNFFAAMSAALTAGYLA